MSLDSESPKVRRETIAMQVKEFLEKGGKIHEVKIARKRDTRLNSRQRKGLKNI